MKYLISEGVLDCSGEFLAIVINNLHTCTIIKYDLIKLILDNGGDVNYVTIDKYTAILESNVNINRLLFEYGADPQYASQEVNKLYQSIKTEYIFINSVLIEYIIPDLANIITKYCVNLFIKN